MTVCSICRRPLGGRDRLAADCGGDCLQCMALVGNDPDCVPEVLFRMGFRKGVVAAGPLWRMRYYEENEDAAWAAVAGGQR